MKYSIILTKEAHAKIEADNYEEAVKIASDLPLIAFEWDNNKTTMEIKEVPDEKDN